MNKETEEEKVKRLQSMAVQVDVSDCCEFEGLDENEFVEFLTLWFKRYLIDRANNAHNFEIILDSDQFTEEEKDIIIFNLDDSKDAVKEYIKKMDKMAPRLNERQRDVYAQVMMSVIYGNDKDWKEMIGSIKKPETKLYKDINNA